MIPKLGVQWEGDNRWRPSINPGPQRRRSLPCLASQCQRALFVIYLSRQTEVCGIIVAMYQKKIDSSRGPEI